MKHIYISIVVLLFMGISLPRKVEAQAIRSSYFMDTYTHRHTLNPALTPKTAYLYLPGLGPLSFDLGLGLTFSDLLHPLPNGKLGTFLHPEVSIDRALRNFKDNNKIHADFNFAPISFGFFSQSSFWSVDIGLRTNIGANLPGALFRFLKVGMNSNLTDYDIKNLNLGADVYGEIAVGHSRDINSSWRVGSKVKLLVGAASIRMNVDQMNVRMSPESWTIDSRAHIDVMGKGLIPVKDSNGVINSVDFDNLGIAGYGAAIDLGFEYRAPDQSLFRNLRLSLGVTDLGFITYSGQNTHRAEAQGSVEYKGFDHIGLDSNALGDQLDNLTDELMKMIGFKEVASDDRITRMLTARLNAGIEYTLWRDRISFGLLSSTRFAYRSSTSELTISANFRPLKWLALTASYSFLESTGRSIGWALNITPKWGLNLFIGTDYNFFKVSPSFIPVNSANFNIYFGLSIPIGSNRNTFREAADAYYESDYEYIQTDDATMTID